MSADARGAPERSWRTLQAGGRDDAPTTLGELCADLGAELLDVELAPLGVDVPVLDAAVHDPADPGSGAIGRGDVVLAVGAADTAATAELLRAAGAAGAAAVVRKPRGARDDELLERARETGVALLTTSPEVAWGQLYELLRTSIAADRSDTLSRSREAGPSDLFALADATAALAGGPITIEDTQSRVLAFSHGGQDLDHGRAATVLGRRVPDDWLRLLRRLGTLDELAGSEHPIRLEFDGLQPRRAIAIRAGTTVLGSIWLAGSDDTLAATADDALREAARIAALHLMRRRVSSDLERRLRSGTLAALLRGEGAAEPALAELDLSADGGFAVTAIATPEAPPIEALSLHERLVDLIVMHLRAFRRRAEATVLDERVYVLAGCADAADADGLRRCLQDGVTRAQHALATPLRAGLCAWPRPDGGADLPALRRGAEQALSLGAADGRVVVYEEVADAALLADVAGFLATRSAPPSPAVERLVRHDAEHGSDYVATLRVFLEAHGDSQLASRRLDVHVNTVRYRVRRAVEIAEIALDDGDARLALELQLRARADGGAPPGDRARPPR